MGGDEQRATDDGDGGGTRVGGVGVSGKFEDGLADFVEQSWRTVEVGGYVVDSHLYDLMEDRTVMALREDIPADSNCGADCKQVIDAYNVLAKGWRMAWGDTREDYDQPLTDFAYEVIRMVDVFIFG
jgi:hypothetical protein